MRALVIYCDVPEYILCDEIEGFEEESGRKQEFIQTKKKEKLEIIRIIIFKNSSELKQNCF